MTYLLGDLTRQIAFQLQNVLDFAVVAFRPNVLVRGGTNQLNANAHAVVDALNGAFKDAVHMKLLSKFRQLLDGALVTDYRRARDHLEGTDFGQLGYEFVGKTVGKILLRGIGREIGQGQDSNGTNSRRSCWLCFRPELNNSRNQKQGTRDYHNPCGRHHGYSRRRHSASKQLGNGVSSRLGALCRPFWRLAIDLSRFTSKPVAALRYCLNVVCLTVLVV